MANKTIKAMIADINNADSDGGGLWLPNIQRLFVWDEEQIEKLFDSIMRQYPLSSMLIWKTKEEVRSRRFIDQYYPDSLDLKTLYLPMNKKVKRLVLDGQQRLQSLLIGLKGSIDGRSLHFDVLSGQAETSDDAKFRFSFKLDKEAAWPLVRFGDLIYTKKLAEDIVDETAKAKSLKLTDENRRSAVRNISRAKREFEVAEAIVYQEIDGTDEDSTYTFEVTVHLAGSVRKSSRMQRSTELRQ